MLPEAQAPAGNGAPLRAQIGAISAEEYYRCCAARIGSEEVLVSAIIEDAFSGNSLNQELVTYVGGLRTGRGAE
jgi:hypothetical protein